MLGMRLASSGCQDARQDVVQPGPRCRASINAESNGPRRTRPAGVGAQPIVNVRSTPRAVGTSRRQRSPGSPVPGPGPGPGPSAPAYPNVCPARHAGLDTPTALVVPRERRAFAAWTMRRPRHDPLPKPHPGPQPHPGPRPHPGPQPHPGPRRDAVVGWLAGAGVVPWCQPAGTVGSGARCSRGSRPPRVPREPSTANRANRSSLYQPISGVRRTTSLCAGRP